MTHYEETLLPWMIDRIMRRRAFTDERTRMVPLASGRVLEIGIGSGLNIPFYTPDKVHTLLGLDPSETLKEKARQIARNASFPVTFIGLSGEEIPLENQSVDTILSTWTLCTIPDIEKALQEMRRVLKSEGRLIFIEHGQSPVTAINMIQNALTPIWRRISGGCHLNRPINQLIQKAGFQISAHNNGPMNGMGPLSFLFRGVAGH